MALITLQFSRQDDIGSDAIRFYEHGLYSHVDTVLPDGRLLGARSDGNPSGVQIRPSNYANFSAFKRVSVEVSQSVYDSYNSFIDAQIGKSYDATAILAFALDRDWRESDSWFCSELCCAALEEAKAFPYKLATTENKITPGDLLLAISVLTNIWLETPAELTPNNLQSSRVE